MSNAKCIALCCWVEQSGGRAEPSIIDRSLSYSSSHRAPTLILVISIYHHHHHNRIFIVHNFTTNPGFANLLLEGIQHLAPNPAKLARYRLKRRRCKNRQQVALAGLLLVSRPTNFGFNIWMQLARKVFFSSQNSSLKARIMEAPPCLKSFYSRFAKRLFNPQDPKRLRLPFMTPAW